MSLITDDMKMFYIINIMYISQSNVSKNCKNIIIMFIYSTTSMNFGRNYFMDTDILPFSLGSNISGLLFLLQLDSSPKCLLKVVPHVKADLSL